MRLMIPLCSALLLSACGLKKHHDEGDDFTQLRGTWDCTCIQTRGAASPSQFNTHRTAVVSASGVVTTTDVGGATIHFQMHGRGTHFQGSRDLGSGVIERISADVSNGSGQAGIGDYDSAGTELGATIWSLVRTASG